MVLGSPFPNKRVGVRVLLSLSLARSLSFSLLLSPSLSSSLLLSPSLSLSLSLSLSATRIMRHERQRLCMSHASSGTPPTCPLVATRDMLRHMKENTRTVNNAVRIQLCTREPGMPLLPSPAPLRSASQTMRGDPTLQIPAEHLALSRSNPIPVGDDFRSACRKNVS